MRGLLRCGREVLTRRGGELQRVHDQTNGGGVCDAIERGLQRDERRVSLVCVRVCVLVRIFSGSEPCVSQVVQCGVLQDSGPGGDWSDDVSAMPPRPVQNSRDAEREQRAQTVSNLQNMRGGRVSDESVHGVGGSRVSEVQDQVRGRGENTEPVQHNDGHAVHPMCVQMQRGELQERDSVRRHDVGGQRAARMQAVSDAAGRGARRDVPIWELLRRGDCVQRARGVQKRGMPGRLLQRWLRRVSAHALRPVHTMRHGEIPERVG